ncbi:hypothetical protein DNTS_032679 [Danionella cerebrum]|uniref:Uncharacterized protein n=1 Tax=Danionella cerebrum TaxID=2873325 RepID=A0A553MPU8_9TELE|nr:hypothetical protein DNTS_032679 [Danionella translucida]
MSILGESSRPITGEHPRMRESIFGACKREEPDHELRVRTLSMGAVEAAPLFLCSSRPEIRVVPAEGNSFLLKMSVLLLLASTSPPPPPEPSLAPPSGPEQGVALCLVGLLLLCLGFLLVRCSRIILDPYRSMPASSWSQNKGTPERGEFDNALV